MAKSDRETVPQTRSCDSEGTIAETSVVVPIPVQFFIQFLFIFYTVFIVLRAAVRAPVSLAVLLGFTCLVAFVYFVYFYEQIND